MPKRVAIKNLTIISLALFVVLLGFKVTDLQNQLDDKNEYYSEVNSLLSNGHKVAGYTCGVLTKQTAKDLLEVVDVNSDFGQGPTDTVREDEPKTDSIFWSDSCRYVDINNNAKYVEFYVASFKTQDDASSAFSMFLPAVNYAEELDAEGIGQALIYDAGVYYLLKDNEILQVAASNGSPAEVEQFSRKVFDTIIRNTL